MNSVSVWVAPPPAGRRLPTAQAWPEAGSAAAPLRVAAEPGLGLATMLQLVPSQCSMRVEGMPLVPFWDWPTAQMSVAETAATPNRGLARVPAGLGLGTTVQLVPSHCSISVPEPLSPTAHTSLLETAVTPRSPFCRPGPAGLVTMLQLVPSQCSVRVWNTPLALRKSPTAQASVAEMAATADRLPVTTLGVGMMLQLVPSQCSASGWALPAALPADPTAQTSLAAMLATALSWLFPAEALGLATTVHGDVCACAAAGASSSGSDTTAALEMMLPVRNFKFISAFPSRSFAMDRRRSIRARWPG